MGKRYFNTYNQKCDEYPECIEGPTNQLANVKNPTEK